MTCTSYLSDPANVGDQLRTQLPCNTSAACAFSVWLLTVAGTGAGATAL
jgi:hypothetical protein